ncbi:hypothetical protein FACS1894162_8960 [Bacteroidia bacterium]|nr:hypothetical protein FACS1894162_8960 [Bacteroidia bacterium]
MAYQAIDIANKILAKASSDSSEELISNMKLQKLLYYQQGFHLAYFGTPLFDEDIEAWMYGPVVPNVYEQFKDHNNKGIEYLEVPITLSKTNEEALFNEVYRVYGKYSAIGLMEMAHQEMPWKSTNIGKGNIIGKDKLMVFFKKRIKNG